MLLFRVNDKHVRAVVGRLAHMADRATLTLAAKVEREMMKVQRKAQRLAPVAEGSLQGSAETAVVHTGPNVLLATVTFGGMAGPYAEVQHEREDFAHTPAQWEAKYGQPFPDTLKGYDNPEGQAHFLYGDPSSAWNDNVEKKFNQFAINAVEADFQRAMRRGGVD